jgi:hypothetical protein
MMKPANGNKFEDKDLMEKPKLTWEVWNAEGGDSGG